MGSFPFINVVESWGLDASVVVVVGEGGIAGEVDGDGGRSKSMPRASEAGGPTGTMREPNSTPIVTSWDKEKRPSQRRMVSCT